MKSLSHDMYLNKILKSFKLLSLCCYQYIHKIAEIEERWNHWPQKNVEKNDIFLSHAFWQPRAVMVVLLNTYVAVFTVIDLPRNENFANITKSTYLSSLLSFWWEVFFRIVYPRVAESSYQKHKSRQPNEYIVNNQP